LVTDPVTKLIILTLYERRGSIKQSRLVEKVCKHNYSKPTVLKRINELIDKRIIIPDYSTGIKSPELRLDRSRVRVYYDFKYYMHFYICTICSIAFSMVLSHVYNNLGIVLGSIVTSIFVLLKCMYDFIKKEDLKIVKILE